MSALGERIKSRRLELGISQTDLAAQIGTSQTQIWRYENGNNDPTATSLIILAEALKVSADWLLGLSPNMVSTYIDEQEQELLKAYHSKSPDDQKKLVRMAKAM